ncbi:hypothetical protein JKP88DRAFT_254552 [Tribonema minus]|uniref:Uncharacterized protein n=1 Tax=Tribonema minus TaxID=303371 RepID=A0A835Z3G8_9STRA|nr:hypothetical protein JKP88DRAFT_254552 [Tribonema minus]
MGANVCVCVRSILCNYLLSPTLDKVYAIGCTLAWRCDHIHVPLVLCIPHRSLSLFIGHVYPYIEQLPHYGDPIPHPRTSELSQYITTDVAAVDDGRHLPLVNCYARPVIGRLLLTGSEVFAVSVSNWGKVRPGEDWQQAVCATTAGQRVLGKGVCLARIALATVIKVVARGSNTVKQAVKDGLCEPSPNVNKEAVTDHADCEEQCNRRWHHADAQHNLQQLRSSSVDAVAVCGRYLLCVRFIPLTSRRGEATQARKGVAMAKETNGGRRFSEMQIRFTGRTSSTSRKEDSQEQVLDLSETNSKNGIVGTEERPPRIVSRCVDQTAAWCRVMSDADLLLHLPSCFSAGKKAHKPSEGHRFTPHQLGLHKQRVSRERAAQQAVAQQPPAGDSTPAAKRSGGGQRRGGKNKRAAGQPSAGSDEDPADADGGSDSELPDSQEVLEYAAAEKREQGKAACDASRIAKADKNDAVAVAAAVAAVAKTTEKRRANGRKRCKVSKEVEEWAASMRVDLDGHKKSLWEMDHDEIMELALDEGGACLVERSSKKLALEAIKGRYEGNKQLYMAVYNNMEFPKGHMPYSLTAVQSGPGAPIEDV